MNLFTKLTQIEPSEIKGALVSFLFIFILMASYMIMKPVRDALPSDWGDVSLAQQWSYTFFVSIIAVSLYNFLASKISIKKLVPGVFIFFSLSFLTIFILYKANIGVPVLGKVFYTWSSVFGLFHISVFWSFISQQYSKSQSKRIFGFINTGASAGAIFGPLLIIVLAKNIDVENILLVTSIALLSILPLIAFLNKNSREHGKIDTSKIELNRNPFSGFQEFLTHKRLIWIAVFIFLFTSISTFFYSIQTDLLIDYTRAERKELLGSVELATNILTVLIGIFAANRISRKFGMPTTLSLVPFVVGGLLLLLSMNPAIMLLLALQVVRRAGNYGITRPGREILYTAVDQEARFKTKPIIDVAVYRGSDVFWIWLLAYLGDGWLNLSVTSILYIAAAIAVIWGLVGVYLGRKHEREEVLT